MKKIITILMVLLFSGGLFAQNITNTLPSNGNFIIKDATNTFFTLQQIDGSVGIGSNTFDATNPEKLLVDCGTTTSVNAIYAKGTINSYFQFNIRNYSTGNHASSDIVTTANNGTESTYYMDMGINNSGYVYQNGDPIETGKANDCYILASGNDLYFVNNNPTKDMLFLVGGTDTTKQRMRIRSNGNVSIGFSGPVSYKLAINGTCYSTGFYYPSDIRLKNNIQPLTNTLENITKLRGVSFNYNNDSTGKRHIGFIAQELEILYPEFVTTGEDGLKAVSYANITAVLLEGIKEQQKQIDDLNSRLTALEKKPGIIQTSGFTPENSNTGFWIFLSALTFSIAGIIIRKKNNVGKNYFSKF
jgi:hypothetical protein